MHHLVGEDVGRMIWSTERLVRQRCVCLETYFEENLHLKPFLQRLRDANKQIFLITNSAFWYVNRGMRHLLGHDWQDFFDMVICQARKPSFFGPRIRSGELSSVTDRYSRFSLRPFREIDVTNQSKSWARVPKLQKGKVYIEVRRSDGSQTIEHLWSFRVISPRWSIWQVGLVTMFFTSVIISMVI